MINLFYIEAPFQLVSAIEVAATCDFGSNILVVRKTGLVKNDLQVRQIIEQHKTIEWERIIYISAANYFSLGLAFILLKFKFLLLSRKVNVIALGDFRGRSGFYFFKIIGCEELWFLDDGIGVLNLYKVKNSKISMSRNSLFKKTLRRFHKGYFNRKITKITLNSFLTLKTIKPFDLKKINLTVVFNKLKIKRQIEKHNQVFFLGAKLVKSGYISEKEYYMLCERVSNAYQGKEIVYVPHREEILEKVEELCLNFGFQLAMPTLPIEFHLCQQEYLPTEIVSVCSAALCTLPKIFPKMKVSVIDFERGHLSPEDNSSFDVCYEYIISTGLVQQIL